MHSYKATFSVVWRAGLRRPVKPLFVHWIGCINAIKQDFQTQGHYSKVKGQFKVTP